MYTDYPGDCSCIDCTHIDNAFLLLNNYIGAIGSNNVLVNDLDVTLSNSTHTFYPLVTTDEAQTVDRKNTIEFIILHFPKRNSNYTVTVSPFSISRTQPYALIISGEVGKFEVMSATYSVKKGLSETAKTTMLSMAFLACCLTACVCWIAFAHPERRATINQAKDFNYIT